MFPDSLKPDIGGDLRRWIWKWIDRLVIAVAIVALAVVLWCLGGGRP